MARIQMPETLSEAQQQACDEVIAGPRGKVPAPMIAWLRNPELACRVQALGELLRYQTSLSPDLTELAIIVVGRHWTSHVEWRAHSRYALDAGVDPQVVADIAARRRPRLPDPRQRVIYDLTKTLLETSRIPRPLYDEAVDLLGETGVAELVALLGYYCLASFTLNVFELGLPEAAVPELNDPDYPDAAR